MNYEAFEKEVQELTGEAPKWAHVLAAVPEHCRLRLISLLNRKVDIPSAYDMILITKGLSDEQFEQKMKDHLDS